MINVDVVRFFIYTLCVYKNVNKETKEERERGGSDHYYSSACHDRCGRINEVAVWIFFWVLLAVVETTTTRTENVKNKSIFFLLYIIYLQLSWATIMQRIDEDKDGRTVVWNIYRITMWSKLYSNYITILLTYCCFCTFFLFWIIFGVYFWRNNASLQGFGYSLRWAL